jgi:glycerol-3-phosphate dehydrogenase
MTSSHLNAARRLRELQDLSGLDVLVVGGGITGVGVALDAASRGLSVALVEKDDLAFGTSRWSSKMVHGGLRYLATGDWAIAMESARERGILMTRTAPHLVRPLPMTVPIGAATTRKQAALVQAGGRAADLLRAINRTPRSILPGPRRIGVEETLRLVPSVRRAGLRGAVLNWDGHLEDDARLVVAIARTAAAHGARILTRVRYDDGVLTDTLTGESLSYQAKTVVNATGAWADTITSGTTLRPSKGVHVVLDAKTLGNPTASITVAVPGESNRYVFALPHADGIIHLGLTDDPLDGPLPEVPRVEESEIAFLLDTLSNGLEVPLTRSDVIGSFAGVRPLIAGEQGRTADLSRRHSVTLEDGLLTVLGGKLTTYRKMAQDAVDLLTDVPCRTQDLPLVGAGAVGRDRLSRRYGSEARQVAAAGPLRPVAAGVPVLECELHWGLQAEGALTAEDLLERRTRLSLVDAWGEAAKDAAVSAVESRHAQA